MRAFPRSRARLLPGGRAAGDRERSATGRHQGGAVTVRALILGGARSGKSLFAERMAGELGGESVLYVATALPEMDSDLERRVRAHRERRPSGWGTLEVGDLEAALDAASSWKAVLLDSLTLWVSARPYEEVEAETLGLFDRFLEGARAVETPFVIVSDEVGLGVVPESEEGRRFRDALGLVNGRAAAMAEEVHLCVAGIGVRVK